MSHEDGAHRQRGHDFKVWAQEELDRLDVRAKAFMAKCEDMTPEEEKAFLATPEAQTEIEEISEVLEALASWAGSVRSQRGKDGSLKITFGPRHG